MRDATQRERVIGERMLDELEVVPDLRARRVGEPRREAIEDFTTIELRRRAGVAMIERKIRRVAGVVGLAYVAYAIAVT